MIAPVWPLLACLALLGLAVLVLRVLALSLRQPLGLPQSDALRPLDWSRAGLARRATTAQRLARSAGLVGVC